MDKSNPHIGKHLLIGVTYVDPEERIMKQIQVHGKISGIDERGIQLVQSNGEMFSPPPDLESLKSAPPVSYRLRSTGEVVENPDLISSWTCKAPPPGSGEQPEP